MITTAAILNDQIDPPEDGVGLDFLNLMDENLDATFWCSASHSLQLLVDWTIKQAKIDPEKIENIASKYLTYDQYAGNMDTNYLSSSRDARSLIGKKSKVRVPIQTRCDIIYALSDITLNGVTFNNVFCYSLGRVLEQLVILGEVPPVLTFKPNWEKHFKSIPASHITELEEFVDIDDFKSQLALVDQFTFAFDTSGYDIENRYGRVYYTNSTEINVPKDALNYITQGAKTEIDKVIASQGYISNLIHSWFDSSFSGYSPVQTLNSVVAKTKDSIRSIKLTNDDGFAILSDGSLRWLPEVDNLDKYNEHMSKAVNRDENGYYTFAPDIEDETDETDEQSKKTKQNQVFYTDWAFGIMTYQAKGSSSLTTLDISGARPANVSHFNTLLSQEDSQVTKLNRLINNVEYYLTKTGKMSNFFNDFVKKEHLEALLIPFDKDRAKGSGAIDTKSLGDFIDSFITSRITSASSYITGISSYVQTLLKRYRILGEDFYAEAKELGLVQLQEDMWGLTKMFAFSKVYEPIFDMIKTLERDDYESFMEYSGVSAATEQLPLHYLIKNYDLSSLAKATKEEKDKLQLLTPMPNDYTPKALHNISDDISFLPHQLKANFRLANENENVVESIAAGGGKTIMALTDALRHQAQGRRVIVICPNYLMRNYVEDSAFVTKGKMNVMPLDINVYNNYGEEKLTLMINNAPPNTLFIAGLNLFSQGKNIRFNYNGKDLVINQVVEFLRSFKWDVAIIDESHMLANSSSNRSVSMARFLSDIKYRRELTGTYINNNCMDAFGQMKYLDPGVLGNIDDFTEKYAGAMRGNKVIAWRQGAEKDIANRIASSVDYINILRKEWAALLPDREENFHIVNLTDAQHKVYVSILTDVLDEIKKDPEMMKLIQEAEDNGDEAASSALEAKLKAYLARIERFLAACDLDPMGKALLRGSDLVSPKSEKINEILDEHFNNPDSKNGKVLIFTSFRNSAESIYNNLDPRWKKYALHYVAERKDELIPLMKKDKNVKIVIGVEQSLNTGHNFQMFTRLIRVESVWNPGTLDQAESRLNRPDPKNKSEARSKIFYDWILCNKTMDITKCSRLISKVLSAAQFNNDDPRYSKLPDLPIVGMTLANIQQNNDYFGSLDHYAKAYGDYLAIQREEYHEFRKNASHKVPVAIPNAGIMKGSSIIDVPYIPGQVIPFQEDIGLVSLEDYALDKGISVGAIPSNHLVGKRVHTEYGDGVISSSYKMSVKVKLDDGTTVSVNKLTAFLIPDGLKKPVKEIINSMIGLKGTKIETKEKPVKVEPLVVPTERKERNRKAIEPQNDLEADNEVEAYIGSMNNAIAVFLSSDDEDLLVESKASELGLHHSGAYWYCHCRRYTHLEQMLELLENKFDIPQKQLDRLYDWLDLFENGRSKLFNLERASRMDMKNFYLRKKKKVPRGELHVFPTVEDGEFFLIAFGDNQQSDTKLARLKVRGAYWENDPTGFYFKTFHRKSEVKEFVTKDLKAVGLTLSNLDEFKEDYKQLKVKK